MILCAVKNDLIKSSLQEMHGHEVLFCDDIYDVLSHIYKSESVAVIIENSAFEITGFMFLLAVRKLYTENEVPVYVLLADSDRARFFNKILNVNNFFSTSEINELKDVITEEPSPDRMYSRSSVMNAFNEILTEEKTTNFIVHYCNYILSNLSDPNVWFDEYVQFLSTIIGIDKVLLKFEGHDSDTIFSSVINPEILQKNITKADNVKRVLMVYSSEPKKITEGEKYSFHSFYSYGSKKGQVLFIFDEKFRDLSSIDITFEHLLIPAKNFYWYYRYQIMNEQLKKVKNEKKYMHLLKKEFLGDIVELPGNFYCVSGNYQTIKMIDDKQLILMHTSKGSIPDTLVMYIYKIINVDNIKSLKDIVRSLNSFINRNLLTFHPIPIGLVMLEKDSAYFTSTNGIPLIVKEEKRVDYLETETPYFGTYSEITCDIKKIDLKLNSEYIVYPDAFFMTFREKELLLEKISQGNI